MLTNTGKLCKVDKLITEVESGYLPSNRFILSDMEKQKEKLLSPKHETWICIRH